MSTNETTAPKPDVSQRLMSQIVNAVEQPLGGTARHPAYIAAPDGFPNEMWTIIRFVDGQWETLKTPGTGAGFYRTRSESKARRDAERLTRGLKVRI